MNIVLKKMALLEKNLAQKEELAEIGGYSTSPYDRELKQKVTELMDRVRLI